MSTSELITSEQHDYELGTAQHLPADMMLLKMENESIMAVARAAPRDPAKIVRQLTDLIEAYPAAADDAIYRKPVGTVTEVTCQNCGVRYEVTTVNADTVCPSCDAKAMIGRNQAKTRKVQKYAEGLSVRAAESIRSIFGYTRLATTAEMLPGGQVKLTGTLVDYAAGNMTSDTRIVSPMYKARGGGMQRTPEDRFLNVVVKAEKAKLIRDVILASVPNIVKVMFWDACEEKLKQLVAPELVEQKIVPAFAEFGISREQLGQIVGRAPKLGWREQERLELRKILAALRDGETTARELLADHSAPPASNGNGSAPRTLDSLTEKLQSTNPDQAIEDAAGEEVAAGPSGTTEEVGERPVHPDNAPEDPAAAVMLFAQRLNKCGTTNAVGDVLASLDAEYDWLPSDAQEEIRKLAGEVKDIIRSANAA